MSKATRRIDICLRARLLGGDISPQPSEAAEVRWVDPADLGRYPIHPALLERINHGLANTEPHIS
ncbi:hypothetical protein AB0G77_32505 [Streptomyces hygroscopicus]|uniref:NUDIX hydrolase n=1 Tax=Streptomyces hygroscopicus TaxID=1912 RepID=UPI00340CDFD1